jgi:hypothetical protein
MTENRWNPWKLTTIGLALVILTAVLVRLVTVNWADSEAQPLVGPAAATSRTPLACESEPQDAAELAKPIRAPQGTSSARPRAMTPMSRPPAISPPEQPDRGARVAQKPIGTRGEPSRSAMVDNARRPARDAASDGAAGSALKSPSRFDWKSPLGHDRKTLSRHDDSRPPTPLSESP